MYLLWRNGIVYVYYTSLCILHDPTIIYIYHFIWQKQKIYIWKCVRCIINITLFCRANIGRCDYLKLLSSPRTSIPYTCGILNGFSPTNFQQNYFFASELTHQRTRKYLMFLCWKAYLTPSYFKIISWILFVYFVIFKKDHKRYHFT